MYHTCFCMPRIPFGSSFAICDSIAEFGWGGACYQIAAINACVRWITY
jgi:hypothetical protein